MKKIKKLIDAFYYATNVDFLTKIMKILHILSVNTNVIYITLQYIAIKIFRILNIMNFMDAEAMLWRYGCPGPLQY